LKYILRSFQGARILTFLSPGGRGEICGYDAARVDGLGELRIFITVVLPLVAPALATLAIFNFIGNWNAFLWPLIAASKPRMFTLPVGLANFSGEAGSDWHYIMTGAAVAMAPLIFVFLIFQKQIVKGIAMTGLKG